MNAPAEQVTAPTFVVRAGKFLDHAYIKDSWATAHKHSAEARFLGKMYFSTMRRRVGRLLLDPRTTISVAVLPDDEDAILGWSAIRDGVLLYAYVRGDWRRNGIGNALVPPSVRRIASLPARRRLPSGWEYVPKFFEREDA